MSFEKTDEKYEVKISFKATSKYIEYLESSKASALDRCFIDLKGGDQYKKQMVQDFANQQLNHDIYARESTLEQLYKAIPNVIARQKEKGLEFIALGKIEHTVQYIKVTVTDIEVDMSKVSL